MSLNKSDLGIGFKKIGLALAAECRSGTREFWSHPLLAHNTEEVTRMTASLRPILYES